eukprot:Nitzschia sp. Nitz4//scaffold76_size158648//49144//51696//NITZ4_002539-RA/size158648-processed-gene-0.263-mRNA-1//-1//CDS//3329557824//546//frame0
MNSDPSSGAGKAPAPGHPGQPGGDSSGGEEMIGSLGEALAGVNLGSNPVHGNGFSFHSEHDASGPFKMGGGQPGNGAHDMGGWGFNPESAAGNSGFNGTNSGSEDSLVGGAKNASTPSNARQPGNETFDLFLSQSPSQVLGGDVFKFGNQNLGGLEIPAQQGTSDPFRTSPTSGVAKPSSSRSNSPYSAADGGRTIQAYHGYDSAENTSYDNNARVGMGSYGLSPAPIGVPSQSASSPYAMGGQNYNAFGSPYDSSNMQSTPQKQGGGNQQQVLYMAVPTPDGRGQMLQPVQMVQLPGKPFAYVLPGQAGAMSSMQPGLQPAMPGMDPQSMMVMPGMSMQPQTSQGSDIMNLVGGNGRSGSPGRSMGNQGLEPQGRGDEFGSTQQPGQQDNLTALYNGSNRPPIESLLGNIRRLSRDQVGCRLVQQALDEEGPMAATLILNEGLPFWGEALVDPFGNYLFQKILEKITPEERVMLVKTVSTRLVNASLNLHGTRSVQKIVELCALDEQNGEPRDKKDGESAADILTRSLSPAAARLCIDSHGNHVIQRVLLKLGPQHAMFVFDAVAESVGDVARHRHGCCVIQRCLDSPPGPARSHLVHRIVDKSLELMQDAYGNYVVQYVLDVCSDEDVHAVCESVVGKVTLLAIQKFSSNVMEKCLERCTDRVKEQYLNELSDQDRIRELMMDPFGNYVVQRALSVATHEQAIRLVEAMRPHLSATQPGTPTGQRNGGVRNTAGGRRIMAKICRRFPNFNLNSGGSRDELYVQSKGHHRNQHHSSNGNQGYGKPSTPRQHHHQPQQQHMAHQPYNVHNPQVHTPTNQFDQHQSYFDVGETYFQHRPDMGGNAPFPSGY